MIGKQRRTPGAISPHEGFFTSPPTSPLYASPPDSFQPGTLPRSSSVAKHSNIIATLPRSSASKANKVNIFFILKSLLISKFTIYNLQFVICILFMFNPLLPNGMNLSHQLQHNNAVC